MTDDRLRQEIMLCMAADELPVTGDFWFQLIFLSRSSLLAKAQELGIQGLAPLAPP